MKATLKVLSLLVSLYLLISLLLSALVSCGIGQWWIIEHRSPFLVAEVMISTVEGYDEPYRQMYGYDQHGDYISFDDDRKPGETVVSVLVWNPHNNYCDDISSRFDFTITAGQTVEQDSVPLAVNGVKSLVKNTQNKIEAGN